MLRYFFFLCTILCLISSSSSSCVDKKGDEKTLLLYGRWMVDSATRGGEETALLNGTWFDFSENGEMETNLQTLEEKTAFSIKNDIIHRDGRVPIDFMINNLTDSMLVLSFEIRSQQFELSLVRKSINTDSLNSADTIIQDAEPQDIEQ